jgi:hypothetical protein
MSDSEHNISEEEEIVSNSSSMEEELPLPDNQKE